MDTIITFDSNRPNSVHFMILLLTDDRSRVSFQNIVCIKSVAAQPAACCHNIALDSVILHVKTFKMRKPFTHQSWDTTLEQFWKPV